MVASGPVDASPTRRPLQPEAAGAAITKENGPTLPGVGVNEGRHILIAVARYLAAHSSTERAALQTAAVRDGIEIERPGRENAPRGRTRECDGLRSARRPGGRDGPHVSSPPGRRTRRSPGGASTPAARPPR